MVAIKFGRTDIARWRAMHSEWRNERRVQLDGVDITNRCIWFDDKRGEVFCFKMAPSGLIERDELGHPVTEHLNGHITIKELR